MGRRREGKTIRKWEGRGKEGEGEGCVIAVGGMDAPGYTP